MGMRVKGKIGRERLLDDTQVPFHELIDDGSNGRFLFRY